jgi:hypothetical protein
MRLRPWVAGPRANTDMDLEEYGGWNLIRI